MAHITVHLQPEGETLTVSGCKSVVGLLNRLGRRPTRTLVIRGAELLTPDRRLEPGDHITLRAVGSRG